MNTDQILKVLKNERECIRRQSWSNGNVMLDGIMAHCDRNCAKCDLCLPDTEILEVYDHLIKIFEREAILIADISEEDEKKIVQQLARAGYGIAPELAKKYLGVVDFSEINPITPVDRLKAPFERLKESLNENLGIKQPSRVMAETWKKGGTD